MATMEKCPAVEHSARSRLSKRKTRRHTCETRRHIRRWTATCCAAGCMVAFDLCRSRLYNIENGNAKMVHAEMGEDAAAARFWRRPVCADGHAVRGADYGVVNLVRQSALPSDEREQSYAAKFVACGGPDLTADDPAL
ncbi:hypothetical protein BU23DRAFT_564502 [Bimuria novae-zelandiae CBS 107.79]|uniref:Uncharacterized protein n=1 Tax=Bimuria novae-zelandiae CBS 107.79 TaxID=1447943 RepID=A0A6A5VLX5_9PLEO|nr:hypothetical protein BU23DRAFT_564502 [Bimuria novae-zelandiae CBS 107.79]